MITRRLFHPLTRSFRNQSSAFRSPISVESLYPGSTFQDRFSIPKPPSNDNRTEFSGFIPLDKLSITNFDRTGVRIEFSINADWLSTSIRDRLKQEWKSDLSKDGHTIIITSNRTRSALLNRADAMQKLRASIWDCIHGEKRFPVVEQALREEIRRKTFIKDARERLIRPKTEPISENTITF